MMKTDRYMIYAYEELDVPDHIKFGEHFCKNMTFEEAVEDTRHNRIRAQLGPAKYKWKDRIKIHGIWEVSELAKRCGKFGKNQHIDDYIRNKAPIPHRKGRRSEFHNISGFELVNRVERYLQKENEPKPEVFLSSIQAEKAVDVLDAIKYGCHTILAELCARFGKTIWSAAIGMELEVDLVVIVSYVKTVFTSFENDLIRFKQFSERQIHVDTQDPDFKKKINEGLKAGKQVVAYLSMCQSKNRQSRIDFLFDINCRRYVIVDEGDYGVHRNGQCEPLIEARKDEDIVIIMTGTNADRAVSKWDIDYQISTTYPELLIKKHLTINESML